MKNNLFKIATFLFLTISIISCSSDDSGAKVTSSKGKFTATINGSAFSSNDITYLPSGTTQAIIAYGASKTTYFSVAVFAKDFPIGQDVNIAFSPSIAYINGDKTYIAQSGTMNFSILEPGKRMKATFSFIGVGDGDNLTIDGQFDVSN